MRQFRAHALATSLRALAMLVATSCAIQCLIRAAAASDGSEPYKDWFEQTAPPAAGESLPFENNSEGVNLPENSFESDFYSAEGWEWQWIPEGLIYHSYMAGVHEPRMSLVTLFETYESRVLMDATLGGRVGLLKFGNTDPTRPAGYQLDFYGAAVSRLDVENRQNLDSTDYVFGLPFTWGDEQLQQKLGYAHLSSHMGDEYAITHPGALADRINYVRDSIEYGVSYYPIPAWRIYGQVDWAFHYSDGAGPFSAQLGAEISRPGPTFGEFAPFMAVNFRLRDDDEFGSDLTTQAGWLRRGLLGQTLRFGLHYYLGKSSQMQFFRETEQQIGLGIWYDF